MSNVAPVLEHRLVGAMVSMWVQRVVSGVVGFRIVGFRVARISREWPLLIINIALPASVSPLNGVPPIIRPIMNHEPVLGIGKYLGEK